MQGTVIAEQLHIVNILPPVDITGGATSQAFSMKNAAHATILLLVGVSAAAWTKILVEQCTAADGTGAAAIPFNMYAQETAGASHDTLAAREAVAAGGRTPVAADNIFYVIEIDARELSDGFPYLRLHLTNGSNSVIASAVAILSGLRYSGVSANQPSATV